VIRIAALLGLLAGPALAMPDFSGGRYLCSRGGVIEAVYVNTAEGALAVLVVEGQQLVLVNEPAASGARYGWPSGGANYVWWTKGAEATLYWREAGEEQVLETCSPME
jgi:membrane-bound inhibitor of C-type lysozyme